MAKELKRLEKATHDSAKNLEFEKAADYRDQLKTLRTKFFGAEMPDLV
jgi:excinuclease ABC subunit B